MIADRLGNGQGLASTYSLAALLAATAQVGRPYLEILRVEALSVGVYELAAGDEDRQQPHGEDEIYVVARGTARITIGDEVVDVAPGAVVYVPARVPHRFHDIREDLFLIVVFAPPEGTVTEGALTAPGPPGSGAPTP
ncbi:MAG: hypothetical protein QOH66_1037 [Actinomycetota bacterium]|nr:hypothetical protein [Actinomycetota bacterium]